VEKDKNKERVESNLEKLMDSNSGSFALHRLIDLGLFINDKLFNCMKSKINQLKTYEKRNKWKKYFGIN
jgi:hypothetical protein